MNNKNSYPLLESLRTTLDLTEIAQNRMFVLEIQSLLELGGFYKQQVDGIWGKETKNAFINFKNSAYLQFPDSLGKTTARSLLELAGTAHHPIPKDIWSNDRARVRLKLPGGKTVQVNDLIPGSSNFRWHEATALGNRNPSDSKVVGEIIKLAQYLDRVRALFGNKPIHINSWYRPKAINQAVGGVSNSTHIFGCAVDFTVNGIAATEVYQTLNSWHGRHGGLGRYSTFTHLDLRGYPARWNYVA